MAVIDDFQVGVTDTMADPFYDALQAALADGNPNVIGIAGRAFLIDNVNGQWLRTHINVVEQRNVGTNRDLLLLPQGVWRQTVSSWHKGAGQTNMDREDSDIERYYQSWNVDPFDKWQLKPLNQTELVMNLTAAEDARTWIQEVRGDMFGAVGTTLFCVSDFETWAYQELTLPGTALDVTSDGEWFYVAHGDGVTAYSNLTGTLTEEATYPAGGSGDVTMVLWSKDRLFTSSGNELYEVTSGAAELVYTQPLDDFRWVDGTEAPDATYFLGGQGDKYEIHRLVVDDQGVLQTPTVAAALPQGEIGTAIEDYLGYIFIGTIVGVRMANPGQGILTLGAVIPTNAPVLDFEGQNSYVWFTNSLIDAVYETTDSGDQVFNSFPKGTSQGLARMDLSTFTEGAFTPAVANDLVCYDGNNWPVFPSSGVQVLRTIGSITGVTTVAGIEQPRQGISGRRVIARAGGEIYAEKMDSPYPGWLEQGRISYSVEDNKAGLYQMVKWMKPNDGTIYLDHKTDGNPWRRTSRVQMSGTSISSGNMSLDGILFSRYQPRFILVPGSTNFAITRWEMRSIPAKGKASRWQVPVMNYQELDVNGVKVIRDPVAELNYLMRLVESGQLFAYQESGVVYSVHAQGFEWKPESLTDNGTGWQGIYSLIIEEIV